MSKKKYKNIGDKAIECLRKKGYKINDCRVKDNEQKQLSFEDKVVTRKEFEESAKKADEVRDKLYSMGYTDRFNPENIIPFELRTVDPFNNRVVFSGRNVIVPRPYSLAEDFNGDTTVIGKIPVYTRKGLDKEIFREKESGNMINGLQITGIQKFMGVEVPVIEGGFGEGQRCVLVKDVAKIHDMSVGDINKIIKNNIDEFEEGVDLLEILDMVSNHKQISNDLGISKDMINRSKNIYLLSESGYMALCMLMKTDKARAIRKQFRREYFAMRATQSEYIKVLEERNRALDERNKALEELDRLNACCNIPKAALKKDIKCFMNSLTKEVIFTKVSRKELYETYRATRRNRPAQPPMSEFEDILFKLNYMQEGDYWLDVVILEDKIRRQYSQSRLRSALKNSLFFV